VSQSGRFDLAIIGGGIIGAWTMFLATQMRPTWRVVLIERSTIASGATAHSAGVSIGIGSSPWMRRLAQVSLRRYQEANAMLGLHTQPVDVCWVADDSMHERLRSHLVGFTLSDARSSSAELTSLTGMRIVTAHDECIRYGGSATAYAPGLLVHELLSFCLRANDARCIEGTQIIGMDADRTGVVLRGDDGSIVRAAHCIVAVGPWLAKGLFAPFARERGIRTKKIVALHVDRKPLPGAPLIVFPELDAFLMPLPAQKRWLFSFRSELWDCAPDRETLRITAGDRAFARSLLDRYVPDLSDDCRGGRVFCDVYGEAAEPIVSIAGNRRIVVAGAGSGAGVRLAPGLAEDALSLLES
jgi:D-hydroxyproline dehydrogenase subunit beta